MHYVVLATITIVMTASYAVSLKLAPQPVRFLPELMTAIVTVYVIFAGIRTRFEHVRSPYWLLFGAIVLIIVCGVIANGVGTGPIIGGFRFYFRAIPFFFLPAIYPFREWQIRQQLVLLTAFALLQLPLAISQRYILLQESRFTGDYVYGTLMVSGTLTIFLVAAVCMLVALFLKRRISKAAFAMLFLLFLIPTTVNETKITIFLLPISLAVTLWVAAAPGKRLRIIGMGALLLAVAGAIFVPIYDYLGKQNVKEDEAMSIGAMFTEKDYFKKYLDLQTGVGTKKTEVGRVDAVVVPFTVIARDPVHFAFGLGLGNASTSNLGSQFSGAYGAILSLYASASSAGSFLLEIGMLGLICALGLHWLIFSDALTVARESDDFIGTLAASWPAIVVLMTITLFYSSTIYFESISYLFWYFSGLMAAKRMQLSAARSKTARESQQGVSMNRVRAATAVGK